MVRKATAKPVTAQMYRHFAAVTIVCTLALAMFANGDARDAVAREVAVSQAPAEAHPTELVRKGDGQGRGFGSEEFDGSYGQPTDGDFGGANSGIIPPDASGSVIGMPAGFNMYGISNEAWARLSEEQKRKIIADHARSQREAIAPGRATQIESLLDASRARSGEASAAD
ncbi:hypothetical protein A6F68_02054 [Tsuneonella dongtanensis]|uniref:Uncharacterized protein n=1 Tax=Tsuneonella dongtanensis TaxID=692370 RepID=A0A1B2AEQ1_9SPHN|nr:hypothetical protein [Tsuneonella dongtanensis]ANY20558.1 hypothetical protein A6F68_02054 [Tsuneonella dongtanensis]